MGTRFVDMLDEAREQGRTLICLQGDSFMESAILRNRPLPWTRPTEYVASYTQLMALLKPDIAVFDVELFLIGWLEQNHGVLAEMRGKKRLRFALKKLLGMEEPREVVRELVSALCASISQPLFLLLPPNARIVNWANMRANGGAQRSVGDLDIDSVSVYIADFLRAFSGLDIAGTLLQLQPGSDLDDGLQELYSPIINVAKHYRWSVGALAPSPGRVDPDLSILDFWIGEAPPATGIAVRSTDWDAPPRDHSSTLLYVPVPGELAPDRVIESFARWRETSR